MAATSVEGKHQMLSEGFRVTFVGKQVVQLGHKVGMAPKI
ncbi:predicted protein [Streptomyces iranensis]|uniref:Uncharacterized protein n=1 Tax=Streptomyces iranensis TaxID=576784 RepID=A0A060ZHQ0_9ACTN|nr:predicted protein [Streptomyces iranensis]